MRQAVNFQRSLESSSSISDVNSIISDINQMLRNKDSYSTSQKSELTSLRQKAYDRKKKINLSETQSEPPVRSEYIPDVRKPTGNKPEFFIGGILGILTSIFLYFQTVPLYESIGFPYAKSCAIGSLMMIIGFALLHSVTRSKIVLALCIYASLYEMGLIVFGSIQNEVSVMSAQRDPELQFLISQASQSSESYQIVKAKYYNPTEKTFQNAWYNEKFVNPAFDRMQLSEKEVINRRRYLESRDIPIAGTLLKIFFRLGIVFLCMISVHYFTRSQSDPLPWFQKICKS